jgi:hypothetical protein
MTDTAVTVEPERVEVVRWRCPFCRKSHSGKSRSREHIARCWFNPGARSCKTCAFYEFDDSEPEVGYVGAGDVCRKNLEFPVTERGQQTLAVHCPEWQPAPVDMVCDGCDGMFPEENLTATDDGRALLCPACHREAAAS